MHSFGYIFGHIGHIGENITESLCELKLGLGRKQRGGTFEIHNFMLVEGVFDHIDFRIGQRSEATNARYLRSKYGVRVVRTVRIG